MNIELTDEQLRLVRMMLTAYIEQLATESREFTYSSIVEHRRYLAGRVLEKIAFATAQAKPTKTNT